MIRRDEFKLFYLSRGGIPIVPSFSKGGQIFNPKNQIDRTQGGIIPVLKGMTKKQRVSDSMYTKLSGNDLVIPVNQTSRVQKFLRKNKLGISGKPSKSSINAIFNGDATNRFCRIESNLLRQKGPSPHYYFNTLSQGTQICSDTDNSQHIENCQQIFLNVLAITTGATPVGMVSCILTCSFYYSDE